jgi:predicted DNA-binding protein YlxM (UPF0122 family)
MTDNSRRVFNYLKEHYGEDLTANKIAEDLGITVPAVTGSVNGLANAKKHPAYAVRNEVEVTNEEGKKTTIKYITLTEEGYNFDPDATAE